MINSEKISFVEGDRVLWVIIGLLAIFSFLPVFSASSNLAYVIGKGTPLGYLVKHFIIMLFGFSLLYVFHKIPYNYFKGISILMMPIVVLLLIYTVSQGNIVQGANASRWIQIPIIGVSFQTSNLASVTLMIYSAYYISKIKDNIPSFRASFLSLWLPITCIVMLILPANFSTSALLFLMIIVQLFIGGYPIKYLSYIFSIVMILLFAFVVTIKAFPEIIPNRLDTWNNRIENFLSGNVEDNYQIERAKIAIANGGILGQGAGKSVMKNFLPQSSSDFIYAIIVEEYGFIGGVLLIILYMILLLRIIVISHKASTTFGKLLVLGLGIPIVFQALLNIGVNLEVFPVTGQTLPLVSSGGTSAWTTFIALGIILSVSSDSFQNLNEKSSKKINNPLIILSEEI
ncbi:MAG: cell division protein FtsW [Flavobacteriaceae bacterium]|nr:cell division protein FtsW [Flavobacteriaceae bacterium]|tara:strand:- start:6007 stop:7209 length:1203 start_codon:yes stop_codon:yes gene_type:complete